MQKINTPDNLFHDGDPSSGALGTIVTAAWLNAMQGELVSVIEAAGIKLDAAKTDQLRLAIAKLVSDAAAPLKHGHAWRTSARPPPHWQGMALPMRCPSNRCWAQRWIWTALSAPAGITSH